MAPSRNLRPAPHPQPRDLQHRPRHLTNHPPIRTRQTRRGAEPLLRPQRLRRPAPPILSSQRHHVSGVLDVDGQSHLTGFGAGGGVGKTPQDFEGGGAVCVGAGAAGPDRDFEWDEAGGEDEGGFGWVGEHKAVEGGEGESGGVGEGFGGASGGNEEGGRGEVS